MIASGQDRRRHVGHDGRARNDAGDDGGRPRNEVERVIHSRDVVRESLEHCGRAEREERRRAFEPRERVVERQMTVSRRERRNEQRQKYAEPGRGGEPDAERYADRCPE
jgi:hypothetical protein